MKRKKKWLRPRHRIVRNLLCWTLGVFARLKYGIKIKRFAAQEKRPYLILYNHQTAFDQFFVGMSFRGPVYYLASEDLFSMGWVSRLIAWLVAPIPIKKQATDVRAILNCMRVAAEGGTIAIAPEGNRTYSGKTEYINPSIVPLVRKLKLPVALYRIEGGYGTHPRWSDVVRRGKGEGRMRAYVSEVLSPEQVTAMSDEALLCAIRTGLDVNEATVTGAYPHRKSAEYLERAIYVCPDCGLSTFHSDGDLVHCERCGKTVRYLPTKQLQGVGCEFPFPFVAQWYDYQCDFINRLELTPYTDTPMYQDRVAFSLVMVYEKKKRLCQDARLALWGDRITVEAEGIDETFFFDDLAAVAVLGKNKLNLYRGAQIYQLKGDERFCALKYVNVFYRYRNIKKGDEHGTFLGL